MPSSLLQNIQIICQRYQMVLLEQAPGRLKIATEKTPPTSALEALRFTSQCQIDIEYWPAARIEQYQRSVNNSGSHGQDVPPSSPLMPHSVTERVDQLLSTALQHRASDIHIEPLADGLRIRLRTDGVLQPLQYHHDPQQQAIIARLKVLGGLDIAERRVPQDGQFTQTINGQTLSFRISTLPIRYGEKMVIRLLHSASHTLALEELGMSANVLQHYKKALQQPQGLILVTGPTGSGKTFTLYSGLNLLNVPDRNLSSVEDPIEIPLAGVNQTQINTKSGLTFQCVLRALLRQDPDVIMVGEIRDTETAEIAVKAAQTGHLVLSTLHTNSPLETLTRLGQMGIPGYLLGPALKLIIAQRLVRRLCPHCRQPAPTIASLPASLWPGTLRTWQATGCDHCFSGYYGRLALFEILPTSAQLQCAIAANATTNALHTLVKKQALTSLFVAGLQAVSRGETTYEEVSRVVGGTDS